MGVFPLADTMTRLSQFPLARGVNAYASSAWARNGWTDEVWWYPHPTTSPRRHRRALTDSTTHLDRTTRCSGTGPAIPTLGLPRSPRLRNGNRLQ